MGISPLTTTKGELKISLYLPSVGFGILLVNTSANSIPEVVLLRETINIYFWGMIITLISAVIWHEFIESYSGPSTGLFERIPPGKTYQSIGFTLYKVGKPEDYPKNPRTPPWMFEVDIPPQRYLTVFVSLIFMVFLIVSYPYTIWILAQYAVEHSSLISGAIAFAQAVFVLRLIMTGMWPDTYRYWEEQSDTSD